MNVTTEQVLVAFSLTLFAGLATGIGSGIAFFARRMNYRLLAVALSFSAGVMLYVSFSELMPTATQALLPVYGVSAAGWITAGWFFGGMLCIALIDALVPSVRNPHQTRTDSELERLKSPGSDKTLPPRRSDPDPARLKRMGVFTALAIALHNFPEGAASFVAALENPSVGAVIAVAIALHNIPEGISVSVPIYYSTGSRRQAFALSLLSGLAEPVGALLGYFVFRSFLTAAVMGGLLSAVAGIMVFVSLDELLPTAREYGEGHEVVYGIIIGMAVMAISLLLIQ